MKPIFGVLIWIVIISGCSKSVPEANLENCKDEVLLSIKDTEDRELFKQECAILLDKQLRSSQFAPTKEPKQWGW